MTFKEYVCPGSLKEAWELNQKKNNRIVAGNMWLRLGKGSYGKLIDLSGLGLDKIEDSENELRIGAMVTLRELEENEAVDRLTGGVMKEVLKYIVGTQFRNTATVGGSVYSRFGFSDVGNILMALGAEVEFYKAGRIDFETFYASARNDDILTAVYLKKEPLKLKYFVKRNTATSLPLLNVAVAADGTEVRVCIGARPGRAKCVRLDKTELENMVNREKSGDITKDSCEVPEIVDNAFGEIIGNCLHSVRFGTNSYASADYRRHLAEAFVKKGIIGVL